MGPSGHRTHHQGSTQAGGGPQPGLPDPGPPGVAWPCGADFDSSKVVQPDFLGMLRTSLEFPDACLQPRRGWSEPQAPSQDRKGPNPEHGQPQHQRAPGRGTLAWQTFGAGLEAAELALLPEAEASPVGGSGGAPAEGSLYRSPQAQLLRDRRLHLVPRS